MNNLKNQNGSIINKTLSYLVAIPVLLMFYYIGLKGFGVLFAPDKAKHWTNTQATVLNSRLETFQDRDSDGNNITTYLATGSYSYTWKGVDYISEQLFFRKKPDGIGTYHHDINTKLNNHFNNKTTIDIWVNPKDPNEAVIFKGIRWPVFYFHMMFLTWGIAFSFFIYYDRAKERKSVESLYDSDFVDLSNSNNNNNSNKRTVLSNINKYLIWANKKTAVSIGLVTLLASQFVIFDIFTEKNQKMLFLIILPIIGIIATTYLYRRYLQNIKFAKSKLIINDSPVYIGGSLSGEINLSNKLEPGLVYKLKLELIEQDLYQEDSTKEESEPYKIKWKDTQKLMPRYNSEGEGSVIPFLFSLPDSISVNNLTRNSDTYYWRLTAKTDNRGVNLNVNFKFIISESVPEDQKSRTPVKNLQNKSSTFSQFHDLNNINTKELIEEPSNIYIDKGNWKNTRAQYSRSNGKHVYSFPPFRNLIALAISVALTILFSLTTLLFITMPDISFQRIIFLLILLPLSIFAILGTLNQIFYSSKITVSYDNLVKETNYPFMKRRTLKRSDVNKFSKRLIAGSGDEFYYNLYVENKKGKKIAIATYIKEGRDLDSLYSKIKREFWLPEDQILKKEN